MSTNDKSISWKSAAIEARCSAHGPFDPRCERCPHCLQAESLKRLEASAPLSPDAQEKVCYVCHVKWGYCTCPNNEALSPAPAPLERIRVLTETIEMLLASAHPIDVVHPAMFSAWKMARVVLDAQEVSALSPQPPTSVPQADGHEVSSVEDILRLYNVWSPSLEKHLLQYMMAWREAGGWQPTLRQLAQHLGWGANMSDKSVFDFVVERERLLRGAQALLETHLSDAPTAEAAIRERIERLQAVAPAAALSPKKLTVGELEELLNTPEPKGLHINPDGTVTHQSAALSPSEEPKK